MLAATLFIITFTFLCTLFTDKGSITVGTVDMSRFPGHWTKSECLDEAALGFYFAIYADAREEM